MLQAVFALLLIGYQAKAQIPCPLDESGTVDLSGRSLTSIDEYTFVTVYDCKQHAENITSLDLSNNLITSVDVDSFSIFFKLLALNISNNQISSLDNNTFYPLRELEILDVSFNSLTKLEAGLISLYKLEEVWFNNNNISEVEPGIVGQENVALAYFNMNYNSMTYLDPWPYTTYQSNKRRVYREFFFEHNQITRLSNYMNWNYDLVYPFEIEVNLQYNKLETISVETLRQYEPSMRVDSVFVVFYTFQINVTNNPFFCDCNLFDLTDIVRRGIFRYSRVEEFRFRCGSPSSVEGIDFLHDLDLDQLVCNITDECPSGCFCQDRPHNDTFFINCTGAGLTEMPDVIPNHSRTKLELILDFNKIATLKNTTYLSQIYNMSMVGNKLKNLGKDVISAMNASRLDFRDNELTSIPREIKKFSYSSVLLSGNPLLCDCDSLWMEEWIKLDGDRGDRSLTCDSETGVHSIVDINLKVLGCTNEWIIILAVCLGVGFALLGIALVFAKRCPYETKVILFKLFRFRTKRKYMVDQDGKEVDIYIVFDDHCADVVGWVRYFLKKLNRKKPIYSVLNPARFTEPGSEAANILKWIGKSKTIIIVLSEKIFENEWRCFEIEDAERRIIEAAARKNGTQANTNHNADDGVGNIINNRNDVNNQAEDIAIDMGEENIENAPKIIYVVFNSSDILKAKLDEDKWIERLGEMRQLRNDNPRDFKERGREWQKRLQQEPWKTRLAGKLVVSPDDRLFWSKLRYELPSKGNGTGDGNFTFAREIPCEIPVRRPIQVEGNVQHGPNKIKVKHAIKNNHGKPVSQLVQTTKEPRVHQSHNFKDVRQHVQLEKQKSNQQDIMSDILIENNQLGIYTISRKEDSSNQSSVNTLTGNENDSKEVGNNHLFGLLHNITAGTGVRPKTVKHVSDETSGQILQNIRRTRAGDKDSPTNSRPGSGVKLKDTDNRIFTIGTRGVGKTNNLPNVMGYSSNMRRDTRGLTTVSNTSSNSSSSSNA